MHTISAPGGAMKSGTEELSNDPVEVGTDKTIPHVLPASSGRRRFDSPLPPPPNDSAHEPDTLQATVDRLKDRLHCDAVAIRLVDVKGTLSYRAESGYPPTLMASHNECHNRSRQCVCEQVLEGRCDPSLPCCTAGGAFVINSPMDRLSIQRRSSAPSFAHLLGPDKEFQSFVIAPIRTLDSDLGVLHCADSRIDFFTTDVIRLIESVVGEIAHDLHYDSLWQPHHAVHSTSESTSTVICPICGRNRDARGVWRADTSTVLRPDPPPDARPIVCPSCLRLCNFE